MRSFHEKTNLCHFFSVCLGVKGGFCKQNWMFFGSNTEFVVEGVVPDLKQTIVR